MELFVRKSCPERPCSLQMSCGIELGAVHEKPESKGQGA